MDNLEWLEKIKKEDMELKKRDKTYISEFRRDYRRIKALEIIAETLINIDDKLNSLINDGKVINVDTHEV